MKQTLIIFILLLVTATRGAFAQTFPVQVTTQIMPPYSIHLADYVTPGTEHLAVNIFLRDINRPELRVKLRVRIEGQGIVLQTKPSYLPPALSLQGGLPERLISADLADYFNPNNLDFTGITKRQFLQTGALPEGVYRFTVEVLEYSRSVKVSNSGTAIAWLILNDPPLINIPKMAEKVRAQYPQNMVFQWTPRHTGSPNSAFNTEYEFRMVEIWPEGRNPNDAMRTSNTFFEETTQSTSLIYGIAEPALIPGRSYAFQVRAKSIVGIDELDLFKNNGYSQVHTFTFGDACLAPTELTVEEVSSSRIKLSWTGTLNQTGYTVSYREAGDPNASWFDEETFFTDHTISSLKPDTEYEYQVLSECGTLLGETTESATTTTDGLPVIDLQCGLPPEGYTFDNTTPLTELLVGDRVMAGDFDVKITKIDGTNGTFSGDGMMVLPLMNNVKVKVKFRSITVNEEYRMTAGHMEVIGAVLDLLPDEVVAMIDDLNETLDDIDDALDDASDVLEDIDNVIGVVADVLDEIGDYLPDDIVEEIATARDEIAAAKTAMSAATTPEAKAAAKAEIKKAKGKLKGGIKKGVDYYAKAIKDLLKYLKNSFKSLKQKSEIDKGNIQNDYDKANKTIMTSYEVIDAENIEGITTQESSQNVIVVSEESVQISAAEVSSLKNDEVTGNIIDNLPKWIELARKIDRFIKIITHANKLINDKDALKGLLNTLEKNSKDFIKEFATKRKEGASSNELQQLTDDFVTVTIDQLIVSE